jgi:hypothetical protein
MKALCVFSGGLDSMLASQIIRAQGIDVLGLFFETPFFSSHRAKISAKAIQLPLKVVDLTEPHLEVVKHPAHGYGGNMNPCIDCHALMLRKAGQLLEEEGANFIITGEVLGQRPMSQNLKALSMVATESGFDPASVGPGGSLGLMQLMPATARAFGAEDPLDPQQNILAGARHLRWLWEMFPGIAEHDRLAFTLAAYNMGLGHMEDVRALAASQGLDPDRWEGNVAAVLPLKEDRRVAAGLPHGFARGTLTLNYVDRVLDKYSQFSTASRQPAVRKIAAARRAS